MNIFAIDEHPVRAARQMVDKHVVKMILEAGQMLSTSHRVLDGEEYYDRTKNNRRIKRWRLSDEREDKLWKISKNYYPEKKSTISVSIQMENIPATMVGTRENSAAKNI